MNNSSLVLVASIIGLSLLCATVPLAETLKPIPLTVEYL